MIHNWDFLEICIISTFLYYILKCDGNKQHDNTEVNREKRGSFTRLSVSFNVFQYILKLERIYNFLRILSIILLIRNPTNASLCFS